MIQFNTQHALHRLILLDTSTSILARKFVAICVEFTLFMALKVGGWLQSFGVFKGRQECDLPDVHRRVRGGSQSPLHISFSGSHIVPVVLERISLSEAPRLTEYIEVLHVWKS